MNKELFLALESGHVITIQTLHRQNLHVLLEVTFQGDTPLHIAAREGHLPIVTWILQLKPSLAGARNKDKNMPLHEAAKYGNRDLVKILLEHKRSSAYHYNKFGETPLIIASKYGHVEIVKLLWEAKSYNDASETNQSLRVAAYGGYRDVVEAMANNSIKPPLLLIYRLLLVLLNNYADLAKAIVDISTRPSMPDLFLNDIENRGATPTLHAAVHGGHLETVETMLNSRAWNDNLMIEEDKCGRCVIHVAAMKGRWDIISKFMDRWSDCVEIRSRDHKSVLHFAVEYNQFAMVSNLLSNKLPEKVAEVVSRDHDLSRNTPLHLAAKNGVDPQLVEYLVSFPRVDVNALNNEDMTALDIASAAAPHNPNCVIIIEKLEGAGGIRSSLIPKSDPSNDSKEGGETDILNTHMVVASLIATVTFAAIFQIPGGIEEDDENSIHYGAAKLAFSKLFRFFMFSDAAAFTTSLTVVVAWLVRQLSGKTYFGRRSELSHLSGVSLLVSILWTIAAFVTAMIIVIKPPNFETLKSTNKEAFKIYNSLLGAEITAALIPLVYVGLPLLMSLLRIFPWQMQPRLLMYIDLVVLTLLIISFTFMPMSHGRYKFIV